MTESKMSDDPRLKSEARGWITPVLERLMQSIPVPRDVIINRTASVKSESGLQPKQLKNAKITDTYVLIWLLIDVVLYLTAVNSTLVFCKIAITLVASWRITELLLVMFRITLWNRRRPGGTLFFSFDRSIVMGLMNYLELIICFGAIYGCWPSHLYLDHLIDKFDPLYFSCITIATVGYGDISPGGWLRLLACLETLIGILIIIFILGRFVALVSQKDKSLDESLDNSDGNC